MLPQVGQLSTTETTLYALDKFHRVELNWIQAINMGTVDAAVQFYLTVRDQKVALTMNALIGPGSMLDVLEGKTLNLDPEAKISALTSASTVHYLIAGQER